jgi:hypothetical protein
MICFMHEGNPYGYLKVGEKVILPANLARMCGLTTEEVEGWLTELKEAGVYEVDEEGAIFSRRMIRDENLRAVRAAGGKLGGNPKLKVNHKDNLKVENEDKQNPTPSSSSSSSSSKDIKPSAKKSVGQNKVDAIHPPIEELFPEVDARVLHEWLAVRKGKSAGKVTVTAANGVRREAAKAGVDIKRAIQICVERSWVGFNSTWLKDGDYKSTKSDDQFAGVM